MTNRCYQLLQRSHILHWKTILILIAKGTQSIERVPSALFICNYLRYSDNNYLATVNKVEDTLPSLVTFTK